jgi:hypothetical protein
MRWPQWLRRKKHRRAQVPAADVAPGASSDASTSPASSTTVPRTVAAPRTAVGLSAPGKPVPTSGIPTADPARPPDSPPPSASPRPSVALPDAVATHPNSAPAPRQSDTGRDPGVDAVVATEVLKVADRIRSVHLRRCLAEALSRLPDVTVVMPAEGTAFDPDVHEWADTVTTDRPELEETVAETLTAGLADRTGRLIRPARVTVHTTDLESK